MNQIAFFLSLALHFTIIGLSYFNIDSLFSTKIKDKGYVVFDYIEISDKSKAPIISDTQGKASKTKSINNKNENINIKSQPEESSSKKNNNNNKSLEDKSKNKKDDNKNTIVLKKEKNQEIKKKQQPKKSNKKNKNDKSKNDSKASEKAIVNLRKNQKKSIKSDSKTAKKSFNSLLDNAIAKNDNENSGIKAEEAGEVLSATQVDLIRQTIRKCWHFPAGLKNAEDLVVDIKMELDKEGNVKKAEILDKDRLSKDNDFKIAAENANRAVLDPKCNPLPLPKEKYDQWKDLELSFNPKDMFE